MWTREYDETLQIQDPATALGMVLPEVKKEAHVVVVAAHMPYNEAVSLSKYAKGVSVMIVAHEGALVTTPQEIDGMLIA